jgi:hypothetical protein
VTLINRMHIRFAAWMREADASGSLMAYFEPYLEENERRAARIEGWILGVA